MPKIKKIKVAKKSLLKNSQHVNKINDRLSKLAPLQKYLVTFSLILTIGFIGGVLLAIQSNYINKKDLQISSSPIFENSLEIPKPKIPEANSLSSPDNNIYGSSDTATFTVEIKDPNNLGSKN